MRSLFIGLTILAVGIAIGFVLARSMEVESTSGDVVRDTNVARAAETRDRSNPDVPMEPVRKSTDRAEAAAPSDTDAMLDAALLELAARLPRERGDAVLTGRAIDESGAPIAGATVVVTGPHRTNTMSAEPADPSSIGRAYGRSPGLDFAMRAWAKQVVSGMKPAGRTQTLEDGTFRLEGLAEGTYSLQGFAEDFLFERATTNAGDVTELVGRTVRTFELDVVREDGSSPDRASVVLQRRMMGTTHFLWTPDAPFVRVAGTTATVQAFVGEVVSLGNDELRADERSEVLTLDHGVDGRGPHRLELTSFPSVHVEVVPGPDAGQPFEPWCDLVRGDLRIPVDTKNRPRFTAYDVTAGPYTVEVGRGDGPAEATRDIVVDVGRTELQIELGPLDPKRYIVVRCVDTAGLPVQDVSYFSLGIRLGRKSIGTGIRTTARPNGEYWISLERGGLGGKVEDRRSIDTLEITAHSESKGKVSQDVDPDAERVEFVFVMPCELMLEVAGVLDPKLRAFVQQPVEGEDRWSTISQSMRVPGDGTLAFTGLTPGPSRLVLRHDDSPHGVEVVETDFELLPGRNQMRVEAAATHDLVVLAPDRADQRFELLQERNGAFDRSSNETVPEDERVVFQNLPPGLYQIRHRARSGLGTETMEVVVPCGEVVFEPMPVGGYEVVGLPEGCLAARLGLRLGDVLVKVDGVDADADMFLAEFTSRTMRDEGAMLVVRRAGSLVEIPARFEDDRPARGILGHGARFKAQHR